jgi:large subunit ribosomal protein L29
VTRRITELRKLDRNELLKELMELKANLLKEKSSIITKGGSKNTKAIRSLRKDVARVLTLLRETRVEDKK